MRPTTTRGRIATLVASCLAAAVTFVPAASAATTPTVDATSAGTLATTATGYTISAAQQVTCPVDAGMAGCTVVTSGRAVVHPVTGPAKVEKVAASNQRIAAGMTRRISAPLTAVGLRELRTHGAYRVNLVITAANQAAPTTAPVGITTTRAEQLKLAPLVLTRTTRNRVVRILPEQSLIVRLTGESASTGYVWKVDRLAATAPLKLVSNKLVGSPSCKPPMTGCSSTRVVTYVGATSGTAAINAALYGPLSTTKPTARFAAKVTPSFTGIVQPRVITSGANNTTVTLSYRQGVVVALETNSNTGYIWRPVAYTAGGSIQTPTVTDTTPVDCALGSVGCAERIEFTFDVVGEVNPNIALGYFAPGASTPEKVFKARIVAPLA